MAIRRTVKTAYSDNRSANRRKRGYSGKESYIGGSVVLKPKPEKRVKRPQDFTTRKYIEPLIPVKTVSEQTKKNRQKARNMTASYMLILVASIGIISFIFMNYLSLHSDITRKKREIMTKESQLDELRQKNSEEYARIQGSIDLEEIKAVAMDELGMRYPDNSQIVLYSGSDNDYVRQYKDIP